MKLQGVQKVCQIFETLCTSTDLL